jgi:hypothetical protein
VNELTLEVCPHDTARNPQGWQRFTQRMAARLGLSIHFEACPDFASFRRGMAGADLVYANPADALHLIDRHGFSPLARPADTYDEAVLVCGPAGPLPQLYALHGSTVVSVKQLLPTQLALAALRERGVTPANVAHRDSWLSVVRSVWNGEAPFGILYRDAYEELSPQGREMIRVMETTDARAAFHMMLARPEIDAALATAAVGLMALSSSPEGRSALAELSISAWLPVGDDDLAAMRKIVA